MGFPRVSRLAGKLHARCGSGRFCGWSDGHTPRSDTGAERGCVERSEINRSNGKSLLS
jgi:hypothetical protein